MLQTTREFSLRLGCAGALAVLFAVGCAKHEDASSPEFSLGDQAGALMPPGRPAIDISPLLDQTSVTLVKKTEIAYGPLKKGSEEKTATDDDAKPSKKPAKAPKGAKVASSGGKPQKRSKIGSALSKAMGMIPRPGSTAKPPATPPADDEAESEESDEPAKPKPPAVKLADAHGAAAEIPEAPATLTPEQMNGVRAAAKADAVKNLMKVAYSLPLTPGSTVGDAIGQPSDQYPGEPEGINVFEARWVDNETLEVQVELTIGQLLTALSTQFEDNDFKPLEALDQGKVITAKGAAKVPGATGGDSGKKPPKRPSKGGGKTT